MSIEKAQQDQERYEYGVQLADHLEKVYPKKHDVDDDLSALMLKTVSEKDKEIIRKRLDKAFIKAKKLQNTHKKERERILQSDPRTGIHRTGAELRGMAKNAVGIASGLNDIKKAIAPLAQGTFKTGKHMAGFAVSSFSFASRGVFGMTPATALAVGLSALGISQLKEHFDDKHMGVLEASLQNYFATDTSPNMQIYSTIIDECKQIGIAPLAPIIKTAAETGFYDLKGNSITNGFFQTQPANLIDLIRHNARDTSFFKDPHNKKDQYRIAMKALLDDPRIETQKGREALVKDLTDNKYDAVQQSLLDIRNNAVIMAQLTCHDLTKREPRLIAENISGTPEQQIETIVSITAESYETHLMGSTGAFYVREIAKRYPDLKAGQRSDVIAAAKQVQEETGYKYSFTYGNEEKGFKGMVNGNTSTVFRDGLNTKFGDVHEYSKQYVIRQSANIINSINKGIAIAQNGNIYTTAPEQKVTAQINNTNAPTSSPRPRLRPGT